MSHRAWGPKATEKGKSPCFRRTSSQPARKQRVKQLKFPNLLAEQSARTSHARAVIPRRDRGAAVRTRLDVVEVRLVSLPRRQLGVQQVVFFVVEPIAAAGRRSQEN